MDADGTPRVVLVHDWLTGMRGGEKCLEVVCRRWPDAQLSTLLHKQGSVSPAIEALAPHTSPLQWLPHVHRYYRYLLPLLPLVVESWRLPACDLVVSFSHCVAKSARPPRGVPHVCYCFTPMRYAWHMREAYFGREHGLRARAVDRLLGLLRAWDRQTANRVTHFVAISKTVQQRITECYGRESVVIYPPVDTNFYCPAAVPREDYFLAVSAFAPYKRLDLAIAACNRLRQRLVIIGSGQDAARLRTLAGPTIQFLGWQPDEVLRDHLRRCRALIFPGEEDFGIVPVEANACGTPVIAFGRGGATETIAPLDGRDPPTGVWFDEQTVDSLIAALQTFTQQAGAFASKVLRRSALRFNGQRFEDELFAYLGSLLHEGRVVARRAA
jgi:glycosyltransferase involved in cell wall biosynthesis